MRLLPPAFALAFTIAATPVFAQSPAIGIDEALRIVRANGLATVTQIELDENEWEAEGRDGAGRRFEIDLNASTGEIIRTERD